MKNIKNVVEKTKNITPANKIPLYYSIEKDAVYTKPGENRFFVTNLINPNDPQDIIEVVNRWKNM